MRLPAVDATLTALVFLEWPPMYMGDILDAFRVCLTEPSAARLRDSAPPSNASETVTSAILSRAAASLDNWCSWDSWLEKSCSELYAFALPLTLPLPPPPTLNSPSLIGGVKSWSVSVLALVSALLVVSWESLPLAVWL